MHLIGYKILVENYICQLFSCFQILTF